jgi:hypothetical protein
VTIQAGLASDQNALPYLCRARYSNLPTKDAIPPNFAIVADLDKVVDLGAVCDEGRS